MVRSQRWTTPLHALPMCEYHSMWAGQHAESVGMHAGINKVEIDHLFDRRIDGRDVVTTSCIVVPRFWLRGKVSYLRLVY
jgi:hypothetical protein